MTRMFARSQWGAERTKTFGIALHIFEQSRGSAKIVYPAGNGTHFEIPIHLGIDPLHLLVLFQDVEIIPQVINLHRVSPQIWPDKRLVKWQADRSFKS